MIDEHVKLVAKIQHYYDVMLRILHEMEIDNLSAVNEVEITTYKDKAQIIKFLSIEYAKTFENFLYKES